MFLVIFQVVSPFLAWMKEKKAGVGGMNIVIIDYVDMSNFIPCVLALNKTITPSAS